MCARREGAMAFNLFLPTESVTGMASVGDLSGSNGIALAGNTREWIAFSQVPVFHSSLWGFLGSTLFALEKSSSVILCRFDLHGAEETEMLLL